MFEHIAFFGGEEGPQQIFRISSKFRKHRPTSMCNCRCGFSSLVGGILYVKKTIIFPNT